MTGMAPVAPRNPAPQAPSLTGIECLLDDGGHCQKHGHYGRSGVRDFSKSLFMTSAALLTCGAVFGAGLYSGLTRNFVYRTIADFWDTAKQVFSEAENIGPAARPIHFLQPARHEGSGVTVNSMGDDGSLVLLTGFFNDSAGLRLIRRDGTEVAAWPVSFYKLFPDMSHLETPPQTDWNIDIHGSTINPDGSVVFNFEYGGTVRLSRCGQVEWVLNHPTHHSIEPAEGGGYWIPGRAYRMNGPAGGIKPFTYNTQNTTTEDDLILKVSEDGRILEQKSVVEIFYDSGLEAVMTATGVNYARNARWPREIVHLNKIAELPRDLAAAFPEFEAGDLMLSLRQHNLIAVVDPDDWRVKWYQVGPWLRQHDPQFAPDGTISIFNNNLYRLELDEDGRGNPSIPRVSNIMRVDPKTHAARVVYGGRPGQELLSVIRGKQQLIGADGLLITEFEAGRAVQVDARGKVLWEYVNRYDEDEVAELTGAHVFPKGYFSVDNWNCP